MELPDAVDVEDLLLDNLLRRGSVHGLRVRAGDHTIAVYRTGPLYDFLEYPEPRAGAFTVSCHADRLARGSYEGPGLCFTSRSRRPSPGRGHGLPCAGRSGPGWRYAVQALKTEGPTLLQALLAPRCPAQSRPLQLRPAFPGRPRFIQVWASPRALRAALHRALARRLLSALAAPAASASAARWVAFAAAFGVGRFFLGHTARGLGGLSLASGRAAQSLFPCLEVFHGSLRPALRWTLRAAAGAFEERGGGLHGALSVNVLVRLSTFSAKIGPPSGGSRLPGLTRCRSCGQERSLSWCRATPSSSTTDRV